MKKLIAMLLAVLMILPLVACGGKGDAEKMVRFRLTLTWQLWMMSTPST